MTDFDTGFVPHGAAAAPGDLRLAHPVGRLERTSYFDGRLLTAEDLTREQVYLDGRMAEVGRVLGPGVVAGLSVGLVGNTLHVGPGVGVTREGIVLSFASEPLTVDLGDGARLATLNDGRLAPLRDGLHAVVLRRSERTIGSIEVFPTDLRSARSSAPEAIEEGVELRLVDLNRGVPPGGELVARAVLARELIGDPPQHFVPSDVLPLGVLAVEAGRVAWLDPELLRFLTCGPRSHRPRVEHLSRHFESLYERVRALRAATGKAPAFEARGTFELLPPAGRLPKASIDPVEARQSFFPRGVQVHLSVVRDDDLPGMLDEAYSLEPIDLEALEREPVEVMVLAPLPPDLFSRLARDLEREPQLFDAVRETLHDRVRLPRFDPLRLAVIPRREPHREPTDAAAWKRIFDALPESDLYFVRRARRPVESALSAIVLARGFELPEEPEAPPPVDDGPAAPPEGDDDADDDTDDGDGGGILPPGFVFPILEPPVIGFPPFGGRAIPGVRGGSRGPAVILPRTGERDAPRPDEREGGLADRDLKRLLALLERALAGRSKAGAPDAREAWKVVLEALARTRDVVGLVEILSALAAAPPAVDAALARSFVDLLEEPTDARSELVAVVVNAAPEPAAVAAAVLESSVAERLTNATRALWRALAN